MKSKSKKLVSTLLAAVLVFSLFTALPLTARADHATNCENEMKTFDRFQKVNEYSYGQYNDMNENTWYGANQQRVIATAYEYNLMRGSGEKAFNPSGNLKLSEAITIATRVHCIYKTGVDEFDPVQPGDPWYKSNVDYAIANGVIKANDFSDYNKTATRAEMAYIFSRTDVPIALLYYEFTDPPNIVNSLPDVNSATRYHDEIIMLYKAGILTGSDTQGTFRPDNPITRAEAAAIICRVILPGLRVYGNTYG
jgi:hypothetical protein